MLTIKFKFQSKTLFQSKLTELPIDSSSTEKLSKKDGKEDSNMQVEVTSSSGDLMSKILFYYIGVTIHILMESLMRETFQLSLLLIALCQKI
jgi:hypothetical protein